MSELQDKPSGILKISVPPAIGLNLLSPVLAKFLRKYPEIKLDIQLENRIVDLLKEGFDLALRSAKLESSNLIAQKIFSIKTVICATENYFKAYKIPRILSDLKDHNCATYSGARSAKHMELIKNKRKEKVHLTGNFTSNNLNLIKQMVIQDICIGILPEFMVNDELKEKKLKRCLTDYDLSTSPLYAIYPEGKFMLPKVKYFVEVLKKNT